jgi:hypothetical protein
MEFAMIVTALVAHLTLFAALETAVAAPCVEPAPAASRKAEILGVWKGTSTCAKVDGSEFCRDEAVVYHVIDVPERDATVSLKAGRVIDDSVQPMYALFFTYRPETGQWTSKFERPGRSGIWTLIIDGDKMTGTAEVLPEMKVVRNVALTRTTQDKVLQP